MKVQKALQIKAVVKVHTDRSGLARDPCHVVGQLVRFLVQAADTAVGIRAAIEPDHYGRAGLYVLRNEYVEIQAISAVKFNGGSTGALNGAYRASDSVQDAAPGFGRYRMLEGQVAHRRRCVGDAEIFMTPVLDDASYKTIFGCDCSGVIHKEILTCRRYGAQRGQRLRRYRH